jgi:hypothetical protein
MEPQQLFEAIKPLVESGITRMEIEVKEVNHGTLKGVICVVTQSAPDRPVNIIDVFQPDGKPVAHYELEVMPMQSPQQPMDQQPEQEQMDPQQQNSQTVRPVLTPR